MSDLSELVLGNNEQLDVVAPWGLPNLRINKVTTQLNEKQEQIEIETAFRSVLISHSKRQ